MQPTASPQRAQGASFKIKPQILNAYSFPLCPLRFGKIGSQASLASNNLGKSAPKNF